jgi:hypothetical protein
MHRCHAAYLPLYASPLFCYDIFGLLMRERPSWNQCVQHPLSSRIPI